MEKLTKFNGKVYPWLFVVLFPTQQSDWKSPPAADLSQSSTQHLIKLRKTTFETDEWHSSVLREVHFLSTHIRADSAGPSERRSNRCGPVPKRKTMSHRHERHSCASFYQSSYVIKRDKEGKRVSLNARPGRRAEEMKAKGIIIIVHIQSFVLECNCWWMPDGHRKRCRSAVLASIRSRRLLPTRSIKGVLRGRWPCFSFFYRCGCSRTQRHLHFRSLHREKGLMIK